eukprot:TRINITY_DN1359_c0_g2_i4.p1 TRINITY_DN1359_c0_g2~~TRINITY_DN1359_c0_g2_i4.p1  ORF type:complete len:394 (+),score=53.89 TRINITY_DN1359_c0_g2_i4:110-1291(+)
MNSGSVLLGVLLVFGVALVASEYVDEIGPAPQKVHVLSVPHARYSAKKHKPLRLSITDFPTEAFKLARMINEYRQTVGLHHLAISPSLMFVATTHANDLRGAMQNGDCGVYSWTEKLDLWKGCCSDSEKSACFESKVEELTSYPGVGVELAFATNYTLRSETVNLVLSAWTASKLHNDVILNKGLWSDVTWKSFGVGVNSEGYATVWFGALLDTLTWSYSPEDFQTTRPTQTYNYPTESQGETWSPTPGYVHHSKQWYVPTSSWYPTQSWFPTSSWYPTQWYKPTSSWYPTQSWYPTSSWFPTQSWYPTTSWYHPTAWYPTTSSPSSQNFPATMWHRLKNHLNEFWMIILSVLVLVLLISNLFMFRFIRKLRQEIRISLLTSQDTSCAIPEKC